MMIKIKFNTGEQCVMKYLIIIINGIERKIMLNIVEG